jgi:hypothetical protein
MTLGLRRMGQSGDADSVCVEIIIEVDVTVVVEEGI